MIKHFKGKYIFLSNFYPCSVVFEGHKFPTVENAYQAAKTIDETLRPAFWTCSPWDARRWGRDLILREDWEETKLGIMEDLLRQKFNQKYLKERLLATKKEKIIHWNSWHDNFWGTCQCSKCHFKGQDHLGNLLTQIREELQKEKEEESNE